MRAPMPAAARRTARLLAALALAACVGSDDNSPDGPLGGEFDGTISGGLTATLDGRAVFARFDPAGTDNDGLLISMGPVYAGQTTNATIVEVVRLNPELPATGTTAVVGPDVTTPPRDQFYVFTRLDLAGGQFTCEATSGTVTVASTAGGRIRGSYAVELACEGVSSSATPTATLTGTFDAVDFTGRIVNR